MNTQINRSLADADVRQRLGNIGFEPSPGSEVANWATIVRAAGIKPD